MRHVNIIAKNAAIKVQKNFAIFMFTNINFIKYEHLLSPLCEFISRKCFLKCIYK